MRTFIEHFLQENLSFDDALKIFGFKYGSYTDDQLKAKYKSLALQFHPDKGGSTFEMQQVNAAYEKLKNGGTSDSSWSNVERRKEYEATLKIYKTATLKSLDERFKPDQFQNFFKEIFEQDFQFTVDKHENASTASSVNYSVEFHNSDKSIVLYFSLYVDISVLFSGTNLTGENDSLQMLISTDILANRRSVKLIQQRYRFERDYSVLSKPEILFPKDKLIKSVAKSTSRKMAKRDILLTFKKELNAESSNEWIYIPFKDDFKLVLFRNVVIGMGTWIVNGLYLKSRRVNQLITCWIYEDEEHINWFVNNVKSLQQQSFTDQKGLETALLKLLNDYKSKFK